MKPKLYLRQLVRRDRHGRTFWRGAIHAARQDGERMRSLCSRREPRDEDRMVRGSVTAAWEVADRYEVTCVKCLRVYSGIPVHGGCRNQYDKAPRAGKERS